MKKGPDKKRTIKGQIQKFYTDLLADRFSQSGLEQMSKLELWKMCVVENVTTYSYEKFLLTHSEPAHWAGLIDFLKG